MALTADLRTLDIDITAISETHLNSLIPNSVFSIEGYNIIIQKRQGVGEKRETKETRRSTVCQR